ncbi:MAG: dienelactone hydrolase family protein, partial [Chloroflexi bacterium]|nr:dienelactone hydrolase family protein [Chloroflexota bacterium]
MKTNKPNNVLIWFRRIVKGILVLVGVVIIVFAGIIAYDSIFGTDTVEYANTEYANSQGDTLYGYLAMPEEGQRPYPAVLLIHEWWGLNEGITI